MKHHRHPHPHVDPRQPRNGARPGTNPPVFAWKPFGSEKSFDLIVARDRALSDVCFELKNLHDPVHLPDKALAPGRYWWKWMTGRVES